MRQESGLAPEAAVAHSVPIPLAARVLAIDAGLSNDMAVFPSERALNSSAIWHYFDSEMHLTHCFRTFFTRH